MIFASFRRIPARCLTKNKSIINIARSNSNILKSSFPDLVIPDVTLPEFIFSNIGKHPNRIAVECFETGRKYTFEEIRQKSITLNKGLRKVLKLKKDDIIGIILPNVPEYSICILGSLLANLKIATINPAGTVGEIRRQIVNTNIKAIFTTCSSENHIQLVLQGLSTPISVITIKTKVTDSIPRNFINFNELCNGSFDIDDSILTSSKDVATILYSSGTSGLPKGVMHTHKSLIATICQIISPDLDLIERSTKTYQAVVPIVLPFFHIYGFGVLLLSHMAKCTKLMVFDKFKPNAFLNFLENWKPKILFLVPPQMFFLINSPNVAQKHFATIENIVCGAAPLGLQDEEKLIKKSGGNIKIRQGYGLTETCLISITNFKIANSVSGSVGNVIQNTEVKIVKVDDPLGNALEQYEEGELFVKGPQVMCGYYNKAKETEDSFVNNWYRTGDLAYYNEQGNIFIKDRLKELIKVKAHQVAPAELEELIRSYPNVTDAVVIGIPHEAYGEVPRAYITLKPNTKIELKELEKFVKDNVAKYKQILGGFSIVDSIPKTASGKYLRKDLKQQYLERM